MISFWILWIFNALMSLIPVCFFFIGMADGSIDADNMLMWLGILAFVGLLLGVTYWLKTKGQVLAAKVILCLSSVPCLLAILYFVIVLTSDGRWN
ncbi:MAG: hypothetical protein KBA14_08235 [Saprospiraceae bacterium]|nr:hypothetical protein [Saprospiraceae bacterium]